MGLDGCGVGTPGEAHRSAWETVKLADHPHLGLILDSFHTLVLKDDPAPIADLPGDRIFYVQLADAPWVNTDVLSHSRHYRCFPGQGEFDVTGFMCAVLDSGYTGTMELNSGTLFVTSETWRHLAPHAEGTGQGPLDIKGKGELALYRVDQARA